MECLAKDSLEWLCRTPPSFSIRHGPIAISPSALRLISIKGTSSRFYFSLPTFFANYAPAFLSMTARNQEAVAGASQFLSEPSAAG
jgi:hypothetical protein